MDPTPPPPFSPLPPVPDARAALVCDDPAWSLPSGCAAGGGIAHLRVWKAGAAAIDDLPQGGSNARPH